MMRVGIVGCGYWGPLHVRVFGQAGDAAVTWACDLNTNRLEHIAAQYPEVRTTRDLGELLASDVDAVVIATPAGTHAALAIRAMEAGKHVLVEKPLATSTAEAQAMLATAARTDRRLMAGHTFIYHAAVRTLRDLVQSGELGELFYVDSKRVNLGLHRKDVDVTWDLASHDVAILRYLLGEDPAAITATGAAFHNPDVPELAYLQLTYPSGVLANLHVSWLDPLKVRQMTIVGSRKMAVWDDIAAEGKLKLFDKGMARAPYYDDFGQWQVAYRYGDGESVPFDFAEPLKLEAQEFLAAIREHREPLTGGTEGMAVVRALEDAARVMHVQRAIALPRAG